MGIFKRKQPIARKSYETYKLMPNISFKANWSGFNARQAILHGYKRSVWGVCVCTTEGEQRGIDSMDSTAQSIW